MPTRYVVRPASAPTATTGWPTRGGVESAERLASCEVGAGDVEQRQVGVGVGAHDLGGVRLAVGGRRPSTVGRPGEHVGRR